MKELHISIKCSIIAFSVALVMLLVCFLTLGSRAQQPGIHAGLLKGTGSVYGAHVIEFHERWGFYMNIYSYNYTPYQPEGNAYAGVSIIDRSDKISDHFYKGITLGVSRRMTRNGSRHPVFAYAGMGNLDITERHRVYTLYACNSSEQITWYDATRKCLSPEISASIAACDLKLVQFGFMAAYKYKMRAVVQVYFSFKVFGKGT